MNNKVEFTQMGEKKCNHVSSVLLLTYSFQNKRTVNDIWFIRLHIFSDVKIQKQPPEPEVFCKKVVFRNFEKIRRKTIVPESLF